MTDGIGRIFGGNSYGVGGFVPQRKEEVPQEAQAQAPVVHEETQVDPNKVMDFLNANNNIFVTPKATTPAELAPEVQDRVVNAMERFEEIYPIVVNEFGEELAPDVMDLVMDKLLGL